MKSSRMKKILAVILCLTLGLSTNMMTMAESVNSPAVESVQEDPAGSGKEQTVENAALQTTSVENTETEAVQPTEAPVPTEAPTPEATPAPTETAVPEVTAEPTEAPVEEITPVPTEEATPEVTAEPTEVPVEETTPVPEMPQVTETPETAAQGTEESDMPADINETILENKFEGKIENSINFNAMSIEDLYVYLGELDSDDAYHWVLDQLNQEKREELENYSLQVAIGKQINTGSANFSQVAPLVLNNHMNARALSHSSRNSFFDSKAGSDDSVEIADGLNIDKKLINYDASTGEGMLQLEAYVTGNVTTTYKTTPVDIVLVLDQSGSMDYNFGTATGYFEFSGRNSQALFYAENGDLYYWSDGDYYPVTIRTENDYNLVQSNPRYSTIYNGYSSYYYNANGKYYQIEVEYNWGRYRAYYQGKNQEKVYIDSGNMSGSDRIPGNVYTKGDTSYHYSYTSALGENIEIATSDRDNGAAPEGLYYYGEGEDIKRIDALKSAVRNFVASVRENEKETDAGHRIAIVGFGSESGYGNNSEVLTVYGSNSGTVGVAYNRLTEENYKNALVSCDDPIIDTAITALDKNGATRIDLGTEMADKIYQNNPVTSTEENNRKRVVIVFTDGVPTTNTAFENDVAGDAIENTYKLKNTYGASVYSIGIFPGAKADVENPTYGNSQEDHANCFMQALSSNYLEARGNTYWSKWYDRMGIRNPNLDGKSYYLSADNTQELNTIFQKLSDEIGGADNTELDETTVVQDVISDYFDLNEDFASGKTIKVFTAECKNAILDPDTGKYTYEFKEPVLFNNASISRLDSGKKIQVSNFNFIENYVGLKNGNAVGKKLIIQIPIKYNNTTVFGGNDIPTNANDSGVYKDDKCFGTFTSPAVNVSVDYKIKTASKIIYLSNRTNLNTLMEYAAGYKADGVNNTFVNIGYTLKKNDGTAVGTLTIPAKYKAEDCIWKWNDGETVQPLECEKYVLECIVTPTVMEPVTKWGNRAVTTVLVSGQEQMPSDPWIHVLKPTIQAKDEYIFLGESTNLDNTWEIGSKWTDADHKHTDIQAVEGTVPVLEVENAYVAGTEKPLSGEYKPTEDSDFKIQTVRAGNLDITEHCMIQECNDEHKDGCIENGSETEHDFTVHVISGEINIQKVLINADGRNAALEGDPSFTFKITRKSDGKSWIRAVTIKDNADKADVEVLSGLEKGEYTITELSTERYTNTAIKNYGSTCPVDTDKLSETTCIGGFTVFIGYTSSSDSTTDIGARKASVQFENTRTGDSSKLTDSDIYLNRFVKENGKWTCKQIEIPQDVNE